MTADNPVFAYLGPAGTHHEEAACIFAERLGIENPELLEYASLGEVFDSVDRGRCEFGVVAVENSLEGSVTATLDSFAFRSPVTILGETVLDIHHCLVTAPGADINEVTQVASHPQGLAQCRRYLTEKLPGRTTITTASTAESARCAAVDPHVAGIAGAFAAKYYGAEVFESNIEDHFGNQTSFALIARQGHPPVFEGENYKTSLALFMQVNRAGTLHMILSEFAYADVNLSMVQSRPMKQALGDYMFFVNLDGTVDDPAVQTALNCLRMKLREVKVLGSYPIV